MSTLHKLTSLARVEAFQWLPRPAVAAAQFRALSTMIRFAEQNVPLYRDKFRAAGVCSRDLRQPSDLQHFPFVSREEIIAAPPASLRHRSAVEGDVCFRTSGTSGQFMEVAYDARANDFLDAVYARALLQTGYRPWQRLAYFWGERRRSERLYERLGLMRKSWIELHPDPQTQLEEVLRIDPHWIYVFPSTMGLLLPLLEARRPRGLRPRGVICHGELLAQETRERIERVLGCPVFDFYGAQEFNRMAWNCRQRRGMHIDADSVLLEVVEGEHVLPVGQDGELVVTGLVNRLMPLIRYRIGDAGRLLPGACKCGRGLPLMEITEGRLDDVLQLPGGRRLGPRTLAPRIEATAGLRQYRLIQKAQDDVELQAVWHGQPPRGAEAELRRALEELLGPSVRCRLVTVPHIELTRRGKLKKIVVASQLDQT